MDTATMIIMLFLALGILSLLFWPLRLLISLILIPLQILSILLKFLKSFMSTKPTAIEDKKIAEELEKNSEESSEKPVGVNQNKNLDHEVLINKLRKGF